MRTNVFCKALLLDFAPSVRMPHPLHTSCTPLSTFLWFLWIFKSQSWKLRPMSFPALQRQCTCTYRYCTMHIQNQSRRTPMGGGGTPMSTTQDVPRERTTLLNWLVGLTPIFESYWLPRAYCSMTPFFEMFSFTPFLFERHVPNDPHCYFKGRYPITTPFLISKSKQTTLECMFNWR